MTVAAGALIGGLVNGSVSVINGNGFGSAFVSGAVSGALIGSGVGIFAKSAVAGTSLIGLGANLGITSGIDSEALVSGK